MPNLRRYSADEISALADGIRQRLADRALPDWGLRNLLDDFRFRAADGSAWTRGPQTGAWFAYLDGSWSPRPAPPAERLEGLANLRLFEGRARPKSKEELPEPGKAPDAGNSPIAYLHEAVERVAGRYAEGRLTSDAAESLLAGIFLVDQLGAVWSLGVQSRALYRFAGSGWARDDGPPALEADTPARRKKHCTNCGALLQENAKFCAECGTPVPEDAPAGDPGAALEKLSAFLTAEGSAYPEPMALEWAPPAGGPERVHNCPHCRAVNVGEVDSCIACKRPLKPGSAPAPSQPPPPVAASSPPSAAAVSAPVRSAVPDAPAPRPMEGAARPPAAPSTAPGRGLRRRWLLIGIGSCLLVACACAAGLLAFGLLNGLPGLGSLLNEESPIAQSEAAQGIDVPEQAGPTSELILEDRFDDPARTAVPLFGPNSMEYEIDQSAGVGLMTAHNPGVLVAVYDTPVVANFEATLELAPLDPVPGAGYGMVFRSDDAADGLADYFLLLASPADGNVSLSRWGPGGFTELGRVPFTPAGGVITLLVRAQAGYIEIEVDGQPGIKVLDAAADPGIFGLAMLSPRDGDQVAFLNFVVVPTP